MTPPTPSHLQECFIVGQVVMRHHPFNMPVDSRLILTSCCVGMTCAWFCSVCKSRAHGMTGLCLGKGWPYIILHLVVESDGAGPSALMGGQATSPQTPVLLWEVPSGFHPQVVRTAIMVQAVCIALAFRELQEGKAFCSLPEATNYVHTFYNHSTIFAVGH